EGVPRYQGLVGKHVVQPVPRIRRHVVDGPAARRVLKVDRVSLTADAVAFDDILGRAEEVNAVAAPAERKLAQTGDLVVGDLIVSAVNHHDAVERSLDPIAGDSVAARADLNGGVHLVRFA